MQSYSLSGNTFTIPDKKATKAGLKNPHNLRPSFVALLLNIVKHPLY
jgi:hypothetical protein